MQFHLNGFRPGDPRRAAPDPALSGDTTDVIIIGAGPAGLTLAAQLARIPGLRFRVCEKNAGPLELGQADGIACRSMEMFEAFGFADQVKQEAYWVNETVFWRPGGDHGALVRADRIQDVADDLSEFPHTILNQARVHDYLLQVMDDSPGQVQPHYQRELIDFEVRPVDDYPIVARFACLDAEGHIESVRARYLVGCDGARSTVRRQLGYKLEGDAARQLWGVMDILAVTDFPDIRLKAAIQSEQQGSLLIIPREGGYLVRMYIELGTLYDEERVVDRQVSPDMLTKKARAILSPYTLDVKEVAWWSAYEIGQRVCNAFDNTGETAETPTVFIVGDACHTHSPKAGQGMNVGMADAFNLGWKLGAVVTGGAKPTLLNTYAEERLAKARELIEFDRDMARLFSRRTETPEDASAFQAYFERHGRYTAGVETRYAASLITGDTTHQYLAKGQVVGKRFHSAPVVRLADAKPMQLGHVIKADGRWRLFAFADQSDVGNTTGRIAQLCQFLLDDAASPLRRYTPADADLDSVIDCRAVFQHSHRDLDFSTMPALLRPQKGRYRLIDYEKVFCPDVKTGPDLFDIRGLDRTTGVLLIMRPDQYIAQVLPLDNVSSLCTFFDAFMINAN